MIFLDEGFVCNCQSKYKYFNLNIGEFVSPVLANSSCKEMRIEIVIIEIMIIIIETPEKFP